jgi:hypothetical protein
MQSNTQEPFDEFPKSIRIRAMRRKKSLKKFLAQKKTHKIFCGKRPHGITGDYPPRTAGMATLSRLQARRVTSAQS